MYIQCFVFNVLEEYINISKDGGCNEVNEHIQVPKVREGDREGLKTYKRRSYQFQIYAREIRRGNLKKS